MCAECAEGKTRVEGDGADDAAHDDGEFVVGKESDSEDEWLAPANKNALQEQATVGKVQKKRKKDNGSESRQKRPKKKTSKSIGWSKEKYWGMMKNRHTKFVNGEEVLVNTFTINRRPNQNIPYKHLRVRLERVPIVWYDMGDETHIVNSEYYNEQFNDFYNLDEREYIRKWLTPYRTTYINVEAVVPLGDGVEDWGTVLDWIQSAWNDKFAKDRDLGNIGYWDDTDDTAAPLEYLRIFNELQGFVVLFEKLPLSKKQNDTHAYSHPYASIGTLHVTSVRHDGGMEQRDVFENPIQVVSDDKPQNLGRDWTIRLRYKWSTMGKITYLIDQLRRKKIQTLRFKDLANVSTIKERLLTPRSKNDKLLKVLSNDLRDAMLALASDPGTNEFKTALSEAEWRAHATHAYYKFKVYSSMQSVHFKAFLDDRAFEDTKAQRKALEDERKSLVKTFEQIQGKKKGDLDNDDWKTLKRMKYKCHKYRLGCSDLKKKIKGFLETNQKKEKEKKKKE